ncbi:uronyl 2-sulfotransferase-like isoform X2 [Ciona intestinalis]
MRGVLRKCLSIISVALLIYVFTQISSLKKMGRELSVNEKVADTARKKVRSPQLSNEAFSNLAGSVVYNRVPKCASTTIRKLIVKLSIQSRFKVHIESKPFIKQCLTETEQANLAHSWSTLGNTTMFVRHLYYVDFRRFGFQQPTYLNVIRDPVERYISAYYFNRFGFKGWTAEKAKKWLVKMSDDKRSMSLDDCVSRNVTQCLYDNPSRYLNYFCGQDNQCSRSNEWSLNKAKENVMNSYLVVGLTEDMENTLKILEHTLPRYFFRAREMFASVNAFRHTRTANKRQPSEKTKQKLRAALFYEDQFYKFVKARFYKQLKSIDLT